MNNDETGGPAYPGESFNKEYFVQLKDQLGIGHARELSSKHPGMTLLDYFAGQALQGYLASGDACDNLEIVATGAYRTAATMIKVRKRYIK